VYAVIDLGVGITRLCIFDYADNDLDMVYDERKSFNLIDHMQDGVLTSRGMEKACDIINDLKNFAQEFGTSVIYLIAFEPLYSAGNKDQVIDILKNNTGLSPDIREEGEKEMFGFAAISRNNSFDGLIINISLNTTRFLEFKGKSIENSIIMPVGCLNLYKDNVKALIPSKKELKKMQDLLTEKLKKLKLNTGGGFDFVYAYGDTAGAALELSRMVLFAPDGENTVPAENIRMLLKQVRKNSMETLQLIYATVPEMILTIIPGLVILDQCLQIYKANGILVDEYGTYAGYLMQNNIIPEINCK